ncbi:MAG: Fic family protein [Alteromonadaceae bacterium]|nr:Fic family protein [Alteromonadaceae bacterium]
MTLTYLQNSLLPVNCCLVGWSALVDELSLAVPVRRMTCVSKDHVLGSHKEKDNWLIFDKRYTPEQGTIAHIAFALKHENIDLLILKKACEKIPASDFELFIKLTPTGAMARKIWFFYEFLTGKRLNLPDAKVVTAVDVLNPKKYFTGKSVISKRHRVRNNLLGSANFCPMVRRTAKLESFITLGLENKALTSIGHTNKQLISRAASFMLLADSRASFAIEGERPARNRIERWGKVLLQAGKNTLDQVEISRLHNILLGKSLFTDIGYRKDEVFLGERDHNNEPLPEFIGAHHQNLTNLMSALFSCHENLLESNVDAVIQAAIISFAFVYIHPLEDGNGRLHRFLIHHVLAAAKFSPAGIIFPVSNVMLERIDEYKSVLQKHSAALMPFIQWQLSNNYNVELLNDTLALYQYIDCTLEAEFLYDCVKKTIEVDLPKEINHLQAHDKAMVNIMTTIEMPDNVARNLIMFVRQNNGKLPIKRRVKEYSKLSDSEVVTIEKIITSAFTEL